jgi:hypothetical protein
VDCTPPLPASADGVPSAAPDEDEDAVDHYVAALEIYLGCVAAIAILADMGFEILAGMPTFTLTDLARMRIDAISFFLLVLLLSAWGVQRLWNALAKDFVRLPTMSYKRALGVITLWGFLFVLVLTMISGARELLTPGAWEKNGATYKLKGRP